MPYNGSGTFTNPYDWVNEANNGELIDATKFKTQDDGVAAGLTNAITRDGQSTITANIPFNNQKMTGLGDATADQDAMNRRTSDARNVRQIGGALSPVQVVSASTVDLSTQGRFFTKTVSGVLTWVFTGPVAVGFDGFILELTNAGTGEQTWPASVDWPSGVKPALTTSGVDVLGFITRDAGTTWRGKLLMRDSR